MDELEGLSEDENKACHVIQETKALLGEQVTLKDAYILLQQYVAYLQGELGPSQVEMPIIITPSMLEAIVEEPKNYKGYIPVPETYRSKKKRFR